MIAALNERINALNLQGSNEKAALGEALRQMANQQPVLRQNATNQANSQGLLYSGHLGSQIGDLETQYLRNQSAQQGQFDQAEAGRQSEISGLQQGLSFDALAEQLAAIERASAAAASAPPPQSIPSVRKTAPGRPRASRAKPVLIAPRRRK
jgi:hypothetical protein